MGLASFLKTPALLIIMKDLLFWFRYLLVGSFVLLIAVSVQASSFYVDSISGHQVKIAWNLDKSPSRIVIRRNGTTIFDSGWFPSGKTGWRTDNVPSGGGYTYSFSADGCLEWSRNFCIEPDPIFYDTTVARVIPGAPSTISFSGREDGSRDTNGVFSINWGAASTPPNIDGYQWCQEKDGQWQSESSCPKVGKSTLSRNIGAVPLDNGSYRYRVRSYATGDSFTEYSGWRTSSTTIVSKPPSSVATITDPDSKQTTNFYVRWEAVTGADYYILECKPPIGSFGDNECSNSNVTGASDLIQLAEGSSGT
ncbi:hypothetical protein [Microbulbifer epialgicus]|uniref:Fibronectin type-III domain-containing protein n=1 Tax=Microbulbifer epialgicus TaxID=393907 RepID=A0ABV4P6N7_9GAMM